VSVVTFYRVAGNPNVSAPAHVFRSCVVCSNEVVFLMTQDQYDRWQKNKEYVQDVFSHIEPDIHEWMISGTHPDCWNQLMAQHDAQI